MSQFMNLTSKLFMARVKYRVKYNPVYRAPCSTGRS